MKKKAVKRRKVAKRKKKPFRPVGTRVDPLQFGVDMRAVLDDVRDSLDGTYAEIGERAGMSAGAVSNVLNGSSPASLGSVAALAHAAGGKLKVEFVPKNEGK